MKYILSGIQIILLSKKDQVVHFLLKRKDIVFQRSRDLWPSNDLKNNVVFKIALWDLKTQI